MMTNPKLTPDQKARLQTRLDQLSELALESPARFEAIAIALADCERALKRHAKRAAAPPSAEYERVKLTPETGGVIEFTGRKLREATFNTRGPDGMLVELEIWETEGGALVPVAFTTPLNGKGIMLTKAVVIRRVAKAQTMHRAVMDFFEWGNYARTMARKLGWDLRVEVL